MAHNNPLLVWDLDTTGIYHLYFDTFVVFADVQMSAAAHTTLSSAVVILCTQEGS